MRATLCFGVAVLCGALLASPQSVLAQGTAADYARANGLRAKYEALAVTRTTIGSTSTGRG